MKWGSGLVLFNVFFRFFLKLFYFFSVFFLVFLGFLGFFLGVHLLLGWGGCFFRLFRVVSISFFLGFSWISGRI